MRVKSTNYFDRVSRRTSIQTMLLLFTQGLMAATDRAADPSATGTERSRRWGNGLSAYPGVMHPAFFAGTAPFQGITHFDDAVVAPPTNLLLSTPSPATITDVGNPSLYPGVGAKATGWDFTITAASGNVTASFTGSGATGTIPATADYCVRLNRQAAGVTLTSVAVKTDDQSLVQLLSVYLKLNLVPNNPASLADITLTGYKAGSPIAGATLPITGIQTLTWTKFDVSANLNFKGIDEFRFITTATGSGVVVSSMFVDEIALPTTPLPLVLTDFSGHQEENKVLLQWTTASEQNTRSFEVQRAVPGEAFMKIGEVPAAGNSWSPLHYNFTDSDAYANASAGAGGYLYRLKMIDLDGKSSYSPVLKIGAAAQGLSLSAWPNPFQQNLSLFIQSVEADNALITIRDISGRLVMTKNTPIQQGGNILSLSSLEHLQKGSYLLTLATRQHQQTVSIMKMN